MALNQAEIDRLRTAAVGDLQNFVDGDWRNSSGGSEIEVISPCSGQQIGTIIDSSEADRPRSHRCGKAQLCGRPLVADGAAAAQGNSVPAGRTHRP